MMTAYGLRQLKSRLMRSAQKEDPEVNELLQECIKGVNRLILKRSPTFPPPTLPRAPKL